MPTDVPMGFEDFVGNTLAANRLKLLCHDAVVNGSLPHIGFFGPAGHGKTTLANIVSKETARKFVYINSVAVKTSMLLRGIITNPENMKVGAVVCFDECHRLPKPIQDNLLSVLEKPAVLVTSYKDQIIRDRLQDNMSFILATTHQGLLNDPLLSRLDCIELEEYSVEEKQLIAIKYLHRVHGLVGGQLDADAIIEIGKRSRSGRDVVKICEWIIRLMRIDNVDRISIEITQRVFTILGIDKNGLTIRDRRLLRYLAAVGQCGLETLEAYLNMPKKDIKDKVEPWLLRRRLIVRASSGRTITEQGMAALRGEEANA